MGKKIYLKCHKNISRLKIKYGNKLSINDPENFGSWKVKIICCKASLPKIPPTCSIICKGRNMCFNRIGVEAFAKLSLYLIIKE